MHVDQLISRLEEVRNEGLRAWNGIPAEFFHWRLTKTQKSFIEIVRTVLEYEHFAHTLILFGTTQKSKSPWNKRPLLSIGEEIEFSKPLRKYFIATLADFRDEDLVTLSIQAGNNNMLLGDFLFQFIINEAYFLSQLQCCARIVGLTELVPPLARFQSQFFSKQL